MWSAHAPKHKTIGLICSREKKNVAGKWPWLPPKGIVSIPNKLISPGGSHAFLPAGKKMQVTGHKSGKSSGHRATVNKQH